MLSLHISADGYIDLESLQKFIDIRKVEFYSVREKNGRLILKFYDKKRKIIKPSKKSKDEP